MGSSLQEDSNQRVTCSDCLQCQMCSQSRCRQCRKGSSSPGPSELGPFLTHGQYVEWKRKKVIAERSFQKR